jgi:malonate decarboxylase delta subunit
LLIEVTRMERIEIDYPARQPVVRRVHVGVVGSGDLEVLLEPSPDQRAHVVITTSVEGYGVIWRHVLDRFFQHFEGMASIEINDFGATPGMVLLRLEQAAEGLRD